MIPSQDQLIEAYDFFARRRQLEERARQSPVPIELPLRARPAAIDAALKMTNELIAQGVGEVAAVLFAFGRHPRSFPLALLAFTTVIAKNVALSRGVRLSASSDDFRDIIMRITENKAPVEEVAVWVELHCLEP